MIKISFAIYRNWRIMSTLAPCLCRACYDCQLGVCLHIRVIYFVSQEKRDSPCGVIMEFARIRMFQAQKNISGICPDMDERHQTTRLASCENF